jgi:hypothetical protein
MLTGNTRVGKPAPRAEERERTAKQMLTIRVGATDCTTDWNERTVDQMFTGNTRVEKFAPRADRVGQRRTPKLCVSGYPGGVVGGRTQLRVRDSFSGNSGRWTYSTARE